MKLLTFLDAVVFVFLMAFSAFVMYGLATDCPNTAGYVYCARPE